MKNKVVDNKVGGGKKFNGWLVLWLGLATVGVVPLWMLLNSLMRRIFDPTSFNLVRGFSPGMFGVLLSLGLAVVTVIKFREIYKYNKRFLPMWIGFFLAIIAGSFWIFMIIGEFLFPY